MVLKVTKFSAVWCAPCRALDPIFKRVSESTEGVEFANIDIDKEPELATTMNIRSVPTIVFEKDGKAIDLMVGLVSEQTIRDKIKELK